MSILDGEEQQQPQFQQSYNPPPQPIGGKTNDFFIARLDGKDIVTDLYHRLSGRVPIIDTTGMEKWVQDEHPMLNKEGINRIMVIISNFLNKNMFLGCLEHEQINERMQEFWINLSLIIVMNYHRWNLKREYRSMLREMIIQTIHSALSRSEHGRESDQLSTATQRMEIRQQRNVGAEPHPMNPARFLSRREM